MLKKTRKTSSKIRVKKSPATERSKLQKKYSKIEKPRLLKRNSNIFVNQALSPKSHPQISSKSRQQEQDLETMIKSHMNLQKHPELAFIDYKSWRLRTSHPKISYLDTLYAKQLAKHYEDSADSVGNSKMNLQNLTKSLEKSLFSKSPETHENFRSPRENSRVNTLIKKTEEYSFKLFSKAVMNCKEVDEASENLDRIRARIARKNN